MKLQLVPKGKLALLQLKMLLRVKREDRSLSSEEKQVPSESTQDETGWSHAHLSVKNQSRESESENFSTRHL